MPSARVRSLDRQLDSGIAEEEAALQLVNGEAAPAAPANPGAEPVPEASMNQKLLTAEQVKKLNDSDEGKKLVAWAMEQYGKLRGARKPYERQWYTNQAFYAGRQYVQWDDNFERLAPIQILDRNMPRIVINKIRPIIRTEMAKLTSQKPTASVMPASNDDEDAFAARAGEQVWESLYNRLNFNQILKDAVYWLCITGTSFIKTYWDETSFDSVSGVYGDVKWAALSPFNLLVPDLTESDIQSQGFVLCLYEKPLEWINQMYSTALGGVAVPETSEESASSNQQLGILGGKDAQPESAMIIEAWVKPGATKLLPEGGFLTIVNKRIIQAGLKGIPYGHGDFPFAKLDHIAAGRFYSESTITDLIPLQIEYNRTQSQVIEAKNKTTKPHILFDDGSVDVGRISTEPGQWIPVRPNAQRPSVLQAQDLPSYVIQFNERMQANFEDLSGQHEVSRGEAPGSITAATAIAYLQERDDSYISNTVSSIERAVEAVGRQTLVLAAAYWNTPRLIKAIGEDGGWEARTLQSADIKNGLDLRIEAGSALPMSKSAKLATVMDFMQSAYVTPQEGFELLEMPMLQQWTQRRSADKLAAQRENIEFRQLPEQLVMKVDQTYQQFAQAGQIPLDPMTGEIPPRPSVIPINEWDNDDVHIEIHELQQKSSSWKLQPQHVQKEMATHVASHKARRLGRLSGLLPPNGPQPAGAYEPGQVGSNPQAAGAAPWAAPTMPGGLEGMGPEQAVGDPSSQAPMSPIP